MDDFGEESLELMMETGEEDLMELYHDPAYSYDEKITILETALDDGRISVEEFMELKHKI